MLQSRLRVRPTSRHGKGRGTSQQTRYQRGKDCHSALLPVFVIAAVWSLLCWLVIWMRLYRSFTVQDFKHDGLSGSFGKRRDIFAAKLKQFLDGKAPITINNASYSSSDILLNDPSLILSRLFDPEISKQVQRMLISHTQYPQLILSAYLEPPLQLDDNGRLRLRYHTPADLTHVSYPYPNKGSHADIVGACSQNGAQWILPTFHPPNMDHYFEGNVFRKKPMFDKRWELASGIINGKGQQSFDNEQSTTTGYCPVDADPYLPWIHDVFPSRDGKYVEFIISNKRRCNTDPKVFQSDLRNLEPQVALMQPVPVKRIGDDWSSLQEARRMWSPLSNSTILKSITLLSPDGAFKSPRYSLATSIDDADGDGKFTRFICRFHTVTIEGRKREPKLKQVILGETLSNYPYNPEHANYLKRGSKPMLTSLEQGHDEQIWNSVYSIRCPVPESDRVQNLTAIVASGESVSHPNGVPSLYVDLVPIRTPVRRKKEGFGLPGVWHTSDRSTPFDPKLEWGDSHIIPHIEASGRWSNIPICRPPAGEEESTAKAVAGQSNKGRSENLAQETSDESSESATKKKHFLVACVWASHSFSTRGKSSPTDSSTSERLREFLVYHKMIAGFDHIYVYDNSDSTDNNINATLAPVTDLLPDFVTRIPWPHRVCNNNRPGHSNPGERSSQYAAEASCRARYGPQTEWMASLDVDEFLISVNKQWESISLWLKHVTATEKDTQILSFFQTRALPNIDLMIPYDGEATKSCTVDTSSENVPRSYTTFDATCVMKNPNKTFIETYNCEPTRHPKPESYAWRAKKQIYRPDFVWNHFVHYSIVTRLVQDKPLESSLRFNERAPYERRVNELTEAFLLHTKTTSPEKTSNWRSKCPRKETSSTSSCPVGIPSSEILGSDATLSSKNDAIDLGAKTSYKANCFRHSRVLELIPKLEKALKSYDNFLL